MIVLIHHPVTRFRSSAEVRSLTTEHRIYFVYSKAVPKYSCTSKCFAVFKHAIINANLLHNILINYCSVFLPQFLSVFSELVKFLLLHT